MADDAQAVFEDLVRGYQRTFRSPSGAIVLNDLAYFCCFDRTTFRDDQNSLALLEGRRQVFLRIMQNMNLSPEELLDVYRQKYPLTQEDEG